METQNTSRKLLTIFLSTESQPLTSALALYLSEEAEKLENPILDYNKVVSQDFTVLRLFFADGFTANDYINELSKFFRVEKTYFLIDENGVPRSMSELRFSDLIGKGRFVFDLVLMHVKNELPRLQRILFEEVYSC